MKYSSKLDIESLNPKETLLLVSPGNLSDMINYPKLCKQQGIGYIFDPGQALPVLQAQDLREVITGCKLLIVNDYEFNLIMDKTGLAKDELLALPETTIITLGGAGSELYSQTGKLTIPSFKAAKVIDPTGAGDAYRGGLLSGLINGNDLETSAIQGSVCASFAVECNGTQVYSFTPEEFDNRLRAN
jgi:adenosine kinase